MLLNRWNRWMLLVGFIALSAAQVAAQYGLKPPSDLDSLAIWYPVFKVETPVFQGDGSEQLNMYEHFGELVQKAKSGRKVESLVIDVNPLKKGGLINLSQLHDVRVVNINLSGPRTAQTDSLFQLIQEWPLLERVAISINFPLPNATSPDQLVALPANLSQLPKLHDVRLSGNAVQWRESFRVLAGLKNLRHLDINNLQPTAAEVITLGGLQQLRELNVRGQSWDLKPETFASLGQLTELTLSSVKVDAASLQRSVSSLTNLETLIIDNTRSLTKLSLSGLTHLKTVELQYNTELVIDAGTFAGLSSLEKLIIRVPKSVDLTGICSLPKLRMLIVGGPAIGKVVIVPDCIGQLTQLTELHLGNLGLDSLPASFYQLSTLEKLVLSSNKLWQIPKLSQLRKLEQLNVSNNLLTALPEDIGQLTQLKSIDVNQNTLTQLPASITQLVNLRKLSLGGNQLERLPDDLGKLRKLQSLWIGYNQLITLPDNLGQLDSLQNLVIGQNRLRTLPNSLTRLKNLKTLAISGNELMTLPADIGALRQLTELRLERLPIKELPISVCELTNLVTLNINATRLRLLPDNIGELSKLRFVNINENELIALPNSIGGWKEVTSLSLENNKLEGLPNGIGRMDKLNTLRISGPEDTAGGIQQLPDSIIHCTNLFSLQLINQPQLDANDVLTKASQLKQLGSINLTNCHISQLPVIDWKKVPWQTFELKHNLLTELPVAILDAPSLMIISVQENRLPEPLNSGFYGKDALRGAFVEAGLIPLERLSKPNRRVSEAYQQMANRKERLRDWDGAFREMQKAIDFAPDTIVSILYWHRANFHSTRKQYTEALSDLDRAIQFAPNLRKDKLIDPALPNQMLIEFWQQKATIFGIMRQYDTALAAITKAESYLTKFGNAGSIHTERGRFLTLKNKLVEADSSYRRAIREYEKLTYANPLIRLTIVELSLLTGQYDRAKQALTDLPSEQIQYGNAILKEYLDTCLSVLKGEQNGTQATERLTAYLSKQPARIYGWSFDLFDNWLAKVKLPSEKASVLNLLTNKTKERQFKPE